MQMIKNSFYSYNYHQPADYRFSLDSVFLAKRVADEIKTHHALSDLSVLDLCSGCGVIGLELNFHLPSIRKIDFLEVQEIYKTYFDLNVAQTKTPNSEFNFLNMNYENLMNNTFKNKYDIIISNPPYFFVGEGLLSPNEFKNRCRFFIDSDLPKMIKAIIFSLKENGKAYLLVRPGTPNGRNLKDEISNLASNLLNVELLDVVRGTNILVLAKKTT
jgi:tRNA1(Val) A37 N6-methylase TrmN6